MTRNIKFFFVFADGNRENYLDEDISMLLSYSGVSYFTYRYFANVKSIVFFCKQLSGKYQVVHQMKFY